MPAVAGLLGRRPPVPGRPRYSCIAIGGRSQGAKTYLEKVANELQETGEDEDALVLHTLKALAATASSDVTLDKSNVGIALVGQDRQARFIKGDELQALLDAIVDKKEGGEGGMA